MENSTHRPTPKRWRVSPLIPPHLNSELEEFPSLLRQLMYNRGITDYGAARAYVDCAPGAETNPFLIKDMDAAVEILRRALQEKNPIAIYGDYDVDGVTSSALLYEFLMKLGHTPRVYIPSRFDEGYGLNLDAVEQLYREGIGLMITVDCGIRSIKEVALAKQLGMRVILSDHHQPGAELPPADAVINTRQAGDPYPYKHLSGVGLRAIGWTWWLWELWRTSPRFPERIGRWFGQGWTRCARLNVRACIRWPRFLASGWRILMPEISALAWGRV